MIARTMEQPYRAAPATRPVVEVSEVTAPLGAGRGVAAALLLVGLGFAMVPQASALVCVHGFEDRTCELVTWRGLLTHRRAIDVRGLQGVAPSGDPDLPLRGSVEHLALASDGRILPLPTHGVYVGSDDGRSAVVHWSSGERVVDVARGFFLGYGVGIEAPVGAVHPASFEVRQVHANLLARAGGVLSLFAPLAALGAALFAERRTRWLRVAIDPNARVARARSVGLGGITLDRTSTFGADPRLQRVDELGASQLSLVSAEGASLALLTGHHRAHEEALDRLIARANRALSEGTRADRSPSLVRRLLPSGFLVVASTALFAQAAVQTAELPATTGTIEVTGSADRCEMEGVTLLDGARIEWSAPIGETTRRFSSEGPSGRMITTVVHFTVDPGRTTLFNCQRLAERMPDLVVEP